MLKRVSPSQVFPSMSSSSRTSSEKKACAIPRTSQCFGGSVVACATQWMRREVASRSSVKMILLLLNV